jgi:hypothetical protein
MSARLTAVGRATGVAATRTDVWNVGGTYVFPPAPVQMSVVSTSASDAAAGTGTRQITIIYLDDQYAQQITTVNMNGLTPVLTTPTNILRVLKLFTTAVGSTGAAVGNISITNGGNTYGRISATYTASRQAIGTIPSGTNGFLTDVVFSGSTGNNADFCEFDLRVSALDTMLTPGVFITVATFGVNGAGGGFQQLMNPPVFIPATADIKLTCSRTVGTNPFTVAGSFSGFLAEPFIL